MVVLISNLIYIRIFIVLLFTSSNLSLMLMEIFAGYKREYGENFEKHQHEATESFIILKTASPVSEFLGCR